MAAWPFADRPASDPMFDLVPELAGAGADAPAPSGAEAADTPAALPATVDAPAPARGDLRAEAGPARVGADAPAASRAELDDAPAPARVDESVSPAPAGATVVDAPTFGKWDALAPLVGPAPELVITGVSTDCCVISTVLPAADAGATITVVTDACAGSTPENHAAACTVMGLYPPQVTLTTTAELLGSL
ncbi:isochorismatase family protein [Propioniciclava coleopterorum]|uniref:Isochorismatase family protein n=2 Tax=Propioniciclava coleopterorum TaxID=2714937 RepID=A0A6G7YAX3_9ACTN|nr:isochorismatase family protein [Propioniciclava coleopterorum]